MPFDLKLGDIYSLMEVLDDELREMTSDDVAEVRLSYRQLIFLTALLPDVPGNVLKAVEEKIDRNTP